MPDENITVKAMFKEITAELTYDANGHGTAPESVVMKYTEEVAAEEALKAEGYTFEEWNTEADGTGISYAPGDIVKEANVLPEATTLFAQWKAVPADPDDEAVTGDDNNLILYGLSSILALLGAGFVIGFKRRED